MQAALSFLWSLRRDEVVAALEARIVQLEQLAKAEPFTERQIVEDPGTPNHVVEMFRITSARDRGELQWTRDFLDRVPHGDYSFAGEPPTGIPTPASHPLGRSATSPDPTATARIRAPAVLRHDFAARNSILTIQC